MAKKRKSLETSINSDSNPALTSNLNLTASNNSSPALVQNSHEFIEENLNGALLDWLKEQALYQNGTADEKGVQENIVKDLADGLILVIKQTPNNNDMDPVLLEEITKYVQKFPMDPKQKSNQQFMEELPTQILDHLKSLQLFQDISLRHDRPSINKNIKKKAAAVLLDDIASWVQNLPIETGSPEEDNNTKEQLESKLVHKIGELNMNSEIFNDDFIYDDILGDEVENLIADIPGEDIKNHLPTLKKDLLAIVKKARKKIRDENAGPIYKQQLYETITKTLPSFDLSLEGKASFEVLKDDVADAFINLCYLSCDEDEANKLKKKINDEIYRFCNNYLKRCPASPLDTSKLNEALYSALKKIKEPQNESFIDDVELVKIKNEINNWAQGLPLKNQFGQEKLHTNKMISLLGKKIHDIENEKELISAEEYNEKIKKEIVKFLSKLPMTTENSEDINELVEKLVHNLRETEKSRKLSASARCCRQPNERRTSKAKLRISFHDASVSPCPVNTCSQTSSSSSSKCPGPNQCLTQKNSSVQTPCKRMQAVGSQIDMTPNVVVNEYHWDSIDESGVQQPRVPCPCPTTSRPPYVVMPQPLESPMSLRSNESCMQPPRTSCPGPTTLRPPYISQRPQSPVSQRSSELKSCLTTRPFPLQSFENRFNKPRDLDQANSCNCAQHQNRAPSSPHPDYDYDDYEYQLPENSATFRHDVQAVSTLAGKQCSNQSFGSELDDNNNSFPNENQHSTPCQLPRTPSQCPPYPYRLSTDPLTDKSEPSSQRNRANSQSNHRPTRQPCPCSSSDVSGQRNVQESQYIPFTPCQGSQQTRNRRPQQDCQQMTPSPFMSSCPPHFSQGQPCPPPRCSIPYTPSPQMPCAFNSRSPCYMRQEPLSSSEEYESGLNCSFQKSTTHLGAFEDEEPQNCMSRYQDWGKVRDEFEYWDKDRPNFDSVETNNHREGRKCKVCKHRHGEYNGRRF